MVTTGPSTGIMSLPRGVRTSSIGNLLILFFKERRHVCSAISLPFFTCPYSIPTVFVVILRIFLELTHHLTESFPPAPAPTENEKSRFQENMH